MGWDRDEEKMDFQNLFIAIARPRVAIPMNKMLGAKPKISAKGSDVRLLLIHSGPRGCKQTMPHPN